MFKDYNKYLSASFKVYLFVLVIIFILKLVGLDYFGLDETNIIINKINNFLSNINFVNIAYFIGLIVYQYLMVSIICKDNSRKIKLFTICTIPFTILIQHIKLLYVNNPVVFILEMAYIITLCKLYNKNVNIKEAIKKLLIILILQGVSYITRCNVKTLYEKDFVRNLILNLDYFFMLLMYQKVILKGGSICQDLVGSSLQMKANLKNLLKRLQTNLHNFNKKEKVEKLTTIIYSILSFLWNTFTLVMIFLISKINGTLIECIFITSAFWITKQTFGKAFHLSSMTQCFIVSNITYYVLNRITTPLGISILVPIMLGVGLSYVTSKFTKKLYKPLYRGMPKDLFEETILKVEDKYSTKYNICYEYYIEKKIAISLSMKYHYSEAGIRKILKVINKKIKELSK